MSPEAALDNQDALLKGKKTAVAGALNLLENRRPEHSGAAARLIENLSRCARPDRHVIGVTGPPGAGKSTLISRLIQVYRSQGRTVGVLSVDPSSIRSGGALLGDRARIACDPADAGVFVRSMAAGRHLGGLAWHTRHCLTLFEAVYERILIETVGVGQSETEVSQVADTVLFVVQPGSGDSLQFMKAGIMEIPHVLVVNKADRKAMALKAFNELEAIVGLGRGSQRWTPRLLKASATEGWGQEDVVAAMEAHRLMLAEGDLATARRKHRVQWIYLMFRERFGSWGIEGLGGEALLLRRIDAVDVTNPFRVLQDLARQLLSQPGQEPLGSP